MHLISTRLTVFTSGRACFLLAVGRLLVLKASVNQWSVESPSSTKEGMTMVMVFRVRRPLHEMGWHQLDDRWARRLVAQADVSPGPI